MTIISNITIAIDIVVRFYNDIFAKFDIFPDICRSLFYKFDFFLVENFAHSIFYENIANFAISFYPAIIYLHKIFRRKDKLCAE